MPQIWTNDFALSRSRSCDKRPLFNSFFPSYWTKSSPTNNSLPYTKPKSPSTSPLDSTNRELQPHLLLITSLDTSHLLLKPFQNLQLFETSPAKQNPRNFFRYDSSRHYNVWLRRSLHLLCKLSLFFLIIHEFTKLFYFANS